MPEPASAASAAVPHKARTLPGWMPLLLMTLLMFALGGYAAGRNSAFYSDFNLNTLFGPSGALPLCLVAMGQANALMVGAFDISVGALMVLVVCVGSYILVPGGAWYTLLFASIGLVAMGVGVGLANAFLVRKLRMPSIIATLATLSVALGIALRLRPDPGGNIDQNWADTVSASWSWMPYAFIGVVVLAAAWDFWLYRRPGGLATRAVGLDETSSRRLGAHAERINWRAFVLSSTMAALAGLFLAASEGIGTAQPGPATDFALKSIAAAVLGGASLGGGRGSFVGAVVGGLFLALIVNVLALPNIVPSALLDWSDALPQIIIGTLTLLALVLYQAPELVTRARTVWNDVRLSRAREPQPKPTVKS
jgi:ribose/xylose/arabinose/galactoside ABC-type transport system permease subunit